MFSRIHPKFATPHVAIIAIAGVDLLLAAFGGFKQLAIFSTATILLVYSGMAVAVIRLRMQHPVKPYTKRDISHASCYCSSYTDLFYLCKESKC